ncbi:MULTISPECIES: GNAT family N-acetyltransferase [unclassified Lysinibacillus]|uniref:GNAT family N-acetyltransferase n=1 Tax=unclassified Lysinibacillus TaxID=2636778 RepID=UPI002552BB65|nr:MULTISPECIES: GNAT family N-acetyltransferase [unclassified Lysinibacillus]MDM5250803.1 GNAT family N-acetyltransferase [Lysinibacillus sp. G4S2]
MFEDAKKIVFRPLKSDDYKFVLHWSMDEKFCEANGWEKNRDEEELYNWWQCCVNMDRKDFIRLGIEYEKRLIGYVDLAEIQNSRAEIGIAIGESQLWGKGIGTTVTRMFINYAFEKFSITKFYSETHETNYRSRKMMDKLGFKEISRNGSEFYLNKETPLIQYKLYL